MASPFDELDRKKLDETHKLVTLLVEQVARLEERVNKNIKVNAKRNSSWGRTYLRRLIRGLREKVSEQAGYIRQLEQQLRL
jgi:hypothetical protein